MRLLAYALLIAAPVSMLPLAPAAAQNEAAATLLVSSSPARDASGKAAVAEVSLAFARKVELFSVTITTPAGEEVVLYQTDYAPGTTKLAGKDFAFTLPEALTQPGTYAISYLLETKGIKSLNGFINFTIEPEFPAPRVVSMSPAAGEELTGPVTVLELELDGAADLVTFDLRQVTMQDGEAAVATIHSFIDDQTPETSIRNADSFAFPLAEPLAAPGDYAIVYGYTVTNPDGSQTAVTGEANFTIR
jgi:methionine-rich copper-binding protein CopC